MFKIQDPTYHSKSPSNSNKRTFKQGEITLIRTIKSETRKTNSNLH